MTLEEDFAQFKRSNESACLALDQLSVVMRDMADSGALFNQELLDAMRYERQLYRVALGLSRRQRYPKRNPAKRHDDAWRFEGTPGPGLRPRPHTVRRHQS